MRSIKPHSVYQVVVGLLQFILLIGLVLAVVEQQWFNAALIVGILLVTLLPMALNRRFQVYVPPEFGVLAILFVFAAFFLGEIRDYYVRFWWWDVVLHVSSGFLLGIVGFLLVYVLNQQEQIQLHMKAGFVALFSFAFAVAAGALWEIFEFGMDNLMGLNMQRSGLRDTMWDLIVDAAGAFAVALLGYAYVKRGRGSFVFRWIETFIERNPHMFEEVE